MMGGVSDQGKVTSTVLGVGGGGPIAGGGEPLSRVLWGNTQFYAKLVKLTQMKRLHLGIERAASEGNGSTTGRRMTPRKWGSPSLRFKTKRGGTSWHLLRH